MRVGGLSLLSRTSDRNCLNIAAWHSPHSLTWRWVLSFTWPKSDEGRRLGFYRHKHNTGRHIGLQIARCQLRLATQHPMWFKDIASRQWREGEELKHENMRLHRELATIKHNDARAADPRATAHLN